MARNPYFTHGTSEEQNLRESIIIESIQVYGQDFYYIPRTLIGKDEILGEDRLSEFKHAYPIEMYLETSSGFEGQGMFIQRFGGMMVEQSATLTVARKTWNNLVGVHGRTIIPGRPNEGDLLYFPLTDGLFEIKFVQHQDPFYQLGQLYVYRLEVELFQYASEKINTGIQAIDDFESLKSFSTEIISDGSLVQIDVLTRGSGYTGVPTVTIAAPANAAGATATATTTISGGSVDSVTMVYKGTEYTGVPTVTFSAPTSGVTATGTASYANGEVTSITITNPGSGYTSAPTITIDPPSVYQTATATAVLGTSIYSDQVVSITLDTPGLGYTTKPVVTLSGGGTFDHATLSAVVQNIDIPDSFGDNNKFKEEAADVLFSEDNPFGEIS